MSDIFKNEQGCDLDKIKAELIQAEEIRLEKLYPDYDAWRAPRNMADTMGNVAYAMYLLESYKNKLKTASDEELLKLYKDITANK